MRRIVYAIANDKGHRKIGVASDEKARLSQLQIGSSSPLEMEMMLPCFDAELVEARLHEVFVHRRVRGEWFDVTASEVWDAMEWAHVDVHGYRPDPYGWIDPTTGRRNGGGRHWQAP